MKNNRFKRLTSLLLSCLFIMGAIMSVTAYAEEAEDDTVADGDVAVDDSNDETAAPSVAIKYKNLAYEDAVQLIFYVESANVAEGQAVKLILSDEAINEVVIDENTKIYAPQGTLTVGEGEGSTAYDAFATEGFAPAELRVNVYAVAVVVDAENNVLASSDVLEYNVFSYCMDRIGSNPTADQLALYTALLDFGAAVQEVLGYTDETIDELGGWANAYYGVKVNSVVGDTVVGTNKYYYTENQVGSEQVVSVDKFVNSGDTKAVFSSVSAEKGMTVSSLGTDVTVKVLGKIGYADVACNYTAGLVYESFNIEKLPDYMTSSKFGTVVSSGSKGYGEWIAVDAESGNSYLHVEKSGVSNENNFKINLHKLAAEGATTFTVNMDFRWNGASAKATNDVMIMKYNNSAGEQKDSFHPNSSALMADLSFGGAVATVGEWVSLTFECVLVSEGNWQITVFSDGVKGTESKTFASAKAPEILFVTRYGEGYSMSFDIDNLFISVQ